MSEHPLPKLFAEGIKISINSDDPPFMSTDLGTEYARVQQAYNFSDGQMNEITRMAIEAAFVDDLTRQELFNKLN